MLRQLLLCCTVIVMSAGEVPTTLPGLWLECESGTGHVRAQPSARCSGGRLVGWITPQSTTVLRASIAEPMSNAIALLHYNQNRDGAARLAVRDAEGREVAGGRLIQPTTGGWGEFAWTSLRLGPLPAGTYELLLSGDEAGTGGHDVLVLLDDRWDGLYQPPERFVDGRAVGTGIVLPALAVNLRPTSGNTVCAPRQPVLWDLEVRNRSSQRQTATLTWSVLDAAGTRRGNGSVAIDTQTTVRQTLTVSPGLPAGWYRLDADIADGERAQRWFSVSDPQAVSAPRQGSWLGMTVGYAGSLRDRDDIAVIADDLTQVGIRLTRVGGNDPDPTIYDLHVDALLSSGIEPHWALNYRGKDLPAIGVGELARIDIASPRIEAWAEAYKQRCRVIMRHFSSPGAERVRYYICGNEPDLKDANTGLPGRPDVAVRLCRAMFEAAREVNPAIVIESPPVSAPHSGYLRSMLVDYGLAKVCHVIGTHVYGSQVLDHGIGKPWEYLAEAGACLPVACSESGVSTGWAKGMEPRPWQTDYMALHYAKLKRMGYQSGMLFTHDEDHSPDWALMRVGGNRLQPNWDFLAGVLAKPRTFRNGGFEEANDPRSLWVPDRNIDQRGWMDAIFDWQATDQVAEGRCALRIDQGAWKWDIAAVQIVDSGIIPGRPVTVRGRIRTTGHAPARLAVGGFDRTAGSETARREVTATEWTAVEITVTPSNPWIAVIVGASPANGKPARAWFDDIVVEAQTPQAR